MKNPIMPERTYFPSLFHRAVWINWGLAPRRNMDGVFLDQLCYSAIDFAHNGVTMYENKPIYSLWHCYEKPLKKLTLKLHQQGKLIFANGK